MATTYTSDDGIHTYTALTGSDNGDTIELRGGAGVIAAIQALSGGGSGFNGGTLTIQISNDNSNWVTAKDMYGDDATLTAAGLIEVATAARYLRPNCDASIDDLDVIVAVTAP